jgi:hypothetical protein
MEMLPHVACDNNGQSNEREVCQMKLSSGRVQTHRKKDNQASLTNYCFTRAVSNRDPGSLVVSISNFPKAEGASAHTKNNPGPHAVIVTFLLKSRLQLTRKVFKLCSAANVIM